MSTELAKRDGFTNDEKELIKATICVGASDSELKLFLMQCQRTGLDPFARQIYALKRWNAQQQREVMAVQTSIDGFRLIAERTGNYAPGPEPTFRKDDGQLVATAYVKKYVRGEWHTVAAEAYWNEYVQRKKDGSATHMWAEKPRIMLAKCAEALALRKAFPQELSGLYTADEMPHDDAAPIIDTTKPNGKHEGISPRARVADSIIKLMNAATDLNGLKAGMETAPKGWYDVKDEHLAAVISRKDERKLEFLRDRINDLAGQLGYDLVTLAKAGQSCGIADIDAMTCDDAAKLIDTLQEDLRIANL